MIKVEKLDIKDMDKLLVLYKQLTDAENNLSEAEQTYRMMQDDNKYYLAVAKDGDKIVGTALAICCLDIAVCSKPFIVVESVVVDENQRGKGVGRLILESIDKFASKNGCYYSIIVSSGHRKDAHQFYYNMGYTDDVKGFRKMYNH